VPTEASYTMKRKYVLPLFAVLITLTTIGFYMMVKEAERKALENPEPNTEDQAQAQTALDRFAWDLERLKSPKTGKIPDNIRSRELAFAAKLPKKEEKAVDGWISRGPNNKGGRTRALAIDVTDENVLLAGGVTGGMWRSTDNGNSWTKTTDPQYIHSVSSLVQDTRPGHESTWYYGTGEEGYGVMSHASFSATMSGDGMFKSTDGGQSWTPITSTQSGTPEANQTNGSYDHVWNLTTDPSNLEQEVVIAAIYNGIIRSEDGGDTWTEVLGLESNASLYTDIHRTANNTFYAYMSAGTLDGIWRSTNGIDWVNIATPGFINAGRGIITSDPNNGNEVYILHEGAASNGISHVLWKYTYVEGNGTVEEGSIFENRSNNLPTEPCELAIGTGTFDFGTFGSQGGFDLEIEHHPTQDEVLFIGGRNIFRSTDGFQSADNTDWIGGYQCNVANPRDYSYPNHHSDQHVFLFSPSNPDAMYNANDGGVYLTNDAMAETVEWTDLNNGYITTQFYTVAIEQGETDSPIIMGGMQDNGTWRTNSADEISDWAEVHNDDGAFCGIPVGADFYIASSQNGRLYKKQLDDDGNVVAQRRIDPDESITYLFINPILLDNTTQNDVYVADNRSVWTLGNLDAIELDGEIEAYYPADDWVELEESEISSTAGNVSALEMSINRPTRLYYATRKGKHFALDGLHTDTQTLVELNDDDLPGGSQWTAALSANPTNADDLMTCFSNYDEQSIWHSTDGGQNWQHVSGNLEESPDGSGAGPAVFWVEIYPSETPIYFAGTSVGLFSTTLLNGDNTVWVQESPDLIGNSVINSITTRAFDGTIVVGTHGRGVFSSNGLTPRPEIYSVDEQAAIVVEAKAFPNPFSTQISLTWAKDFEPTALRISDAQGRIVHQQTVVGSTVVWSPSAELAKGVYTYVLQDAKQTATGTVIYQ